MRRLFGKRGDGPPDPADPPEPGPCATAGVAGALPPGGPATVGGVQLPAGRRVRATFDDSGGPEVLWRTDGPPADPLVTWAALAAAFPQTGLWPLLLESDWEDDLGHDPDWALRAARDPATVLGEMWRASPALDEDGDEPDPSREPFGLDPPDLGRRAPVVRAALLGGALRRDRRRARPRTLYLAVRRPARGDTALRAAAERCALCLDNVDQGAGSIRALTRLTDGCRGMGVLVGLT